MSSGAVTGTTYDGGADATNTKTGAYWSSIYDPAPSTSLRVNYLVDEALAPGEGLISPEALEWIPHSTEATIGGWFYYNPPASDTNTVFKTIFNYGPGHDWGTNASTGSHAP